jgi:K+-transporting ATPase ATPase B chain
VIRESGGDRSAVTSGTKVLGDRIIIRITSEKGETFLDHTINLIEGANRQKTAGEQMLNFYLISFNLIFLLTILSLKFFENYAYSGSKDFILTVPVLIVLFVSLVPKTIAALMRCTVISAIIRLSRENLILKSGRSLEDSADVDVLLLDKTGTITLGNREATDFIPAEGFTELQLAELAQLASIADETPEGRSVVILAKNRFGLRGEKIDVHRAHFIPFSNKSRMSGVDYYNAQGNMTLSVRKGAVDAIKDHVRSLGGHFPDQIETDVEKIVHQGSTPLAVCIFNRIAGVICLKDKIRGKLKERFLELREMGIRTVMITNDNPLTAAAIAAEAGVDDFVAEATPEIKLKLVRDEQKNGQLVAMTGDGISDVPALAQADVGLALSTGTEATREASNIIDLDSNPTKILEAVIASKQMLMTWGAITTYSLSSAIAKYFAILPAIFRYESPLQVLNIMHLHSPKSAILSTAIFNAIFIAFLIPLAIKGVPYQSGTADAILRKNLLIYGISGLVFPFIIIKCIDSALVFWGVI